MKQLRVLASLIAIVIAPLIGAGQAAAQSQSIVQEIHVKAVVPSHRDIILDNSGSITKIVSNTQEDVMPTVYRLDDSPANQQPLTDEIYAAYRQLVPIGTAKYGVLYQRTIAQMLMAPTHTGAPSVTPSQSQSDLAFLLNNYHPTL